MLACLFFSGLYAQEKFKAFKLDTINIHGIVLDHLGKPAEAVIYPRGKTYPEDTKTDKKGEFLIKGAQFIDTIIVISSVSRMVIPNNGSRFLEVTLPPGENHEMTSNSLEISAQRTKPKLSASDISIDQTVMFDNHFYEKLAYFKGGYVGLETYLRSKIIYPQRAIDSNIEGEVEVSFIVNEYGFPKDLKILRGLGFACDQQVIKALQNCPPWTPGIFNGKKAATLSSVTVNFKLTDK